MTKKIIAFQGSLGANSNLACQKFYPELMAESYASFEEVFDAVETGKATFGMIPLENSSAGRVSEIYDLLKNSNIAVIGEHFLKIEHHLAILPDADLADVKDVYSHPQALMQCRKNLQKLNLTAHAFSNTADAAQSVAQKADKTRAAICSQLAAEINGLKIAQSNLQDMACNATIFITIAKEPLQNIDFGAHPITFLMFEIKNYSGALYEALGAFAKNNVDMMQIESFIRGGTSKQSTFFAIIAGAASQDNVSLALTQLKEYASEVRVFGSYAADQSRIA